MCFCRLGATSKEDSLAPKAGMLPVFFNILQHALAGEQAHINIIMLGSGEAGGLMCDGGFGCLLGLRVVYLEYILVVSATSGEAGGLMCDGGFGCLLVRTTHGLQV